MTEKESPPSGEGGTPAPSPVITPPKPPISSTRRIDLLVAAIGIAGLVLGLFSIYVTLDGRITKVREDEDRSLYAVKETAKDGMGRLERTVASLCENLGDIKEAQFEVQCKKEDGVYQLNVHACQHKDGTAEPFKRPCPDEFYHPSAQP